VAVVTWVAVAAVVVRVAAVEPVVAAVVEAVNCAHAQDQTKLCPEQLRQLSMERSTVCGIAHSTHVSVGFGFCMTMPETCTGALLLETMA